MTTKGISFLWHKKMTFFGIIFASFEKDAVMYMRDFFLILIILSKTDAKFGNKKEFKNLSGPKTKSQSPIQTAPFQKWGKKKKIFFQIQKLTISNKTDAKTTNKNHF